MKHTNTGSQAHNNTGYVNHTNTYANHSNVYANHTNTYGNHNNYYYRHLNAENEYDPYEDIDYSIYEDRSAEISPRFGGSSSYGDYSQYYRHTNTGAVHKNTGSGNPQNYQQYTQQGSGASNYNQYTQSGYSNHTNTGYSNHINTNVNKEPTAASNINLGTFAYYKDTVKLVWQAATDNNKCISVISVSSGSSGTAGIYEQGTLKIGATRGTTIGYWNTNGVWAGSQIQDTYGNIGLISNLQTYYNSIPNGSFVAFATQDAIFPDQNSMATYQNFLKAYGFTKTAQLDGHRSAFAGILKKGTGVLSETAHRYGTNPVSAGTVSAQYTIPNVPSGQTMKYIIEYAFKGIGQSSYGSWTKITEITSLEYSYSLANHGNGFIKFRILASDGVESATSYVESKEIRILKYTAPNLDTTSKDGKATAAEFNTIIVEINKLAEAAGTTRSSLTVAPGNIIRKTEATEVNSKQSEINAITKKTSAQINVDDTLKAATVQNIKNWLKEI